MAEIVAFLVAAGAIGIAGAAVGMLVIAPRLSRWADRDEERGDGDD